MRTRVEHLTQVQVDALQNNVSPLQSLLGTGPSTSDAMPEIVDEVITISLTPFKFVKLKYFRIRYVR